MENEKNNANFVMVKYEKMRPILFILLFQISLQCYCQDNDSLIFSLNGKVITAESNLTAKYPKANIIIDKDNYIVTGDSLGYFIFNKKIKKGVNQTIIVIDGIENYKQSIFKLPIDTAKDYYKTKFEFKLEPEIICIDTWIIPDIMFEENSDKIIYSVHGNGNTIKLPIDTVLIDWIKRWKKEFAKSTWKTKIDIEAFADYDEDNSISKKRLKLIYNKLIGFGVPSKLLVKSNKNKQDREYFKYRDGCHPYFLVEKQPLIIDKTYIDSINGEKKQVKQLRRVVSFKWIFNKK